MSKNICFFSPGFAFNRLNRLKYYEKSFPKATKIFLFTTDKFKGKEKESYQYPWGGLERTKVIVGNYNFFLPWDLRKFLRKNKVDRITNLGAFESCFILFLSTLLLKTKYFLNHYEAFSLLGESKLKFYFKKSFFTFLMLFSEKTILNDLGEINDFNKIKKFIPFFNFKLNYLPVPVDSKIFYPKDKKSCRKKLGLPKNQNIVIFVGRVTYGKCSDILIKLIESNPDILFIVIGRMMDKNFNKLKSKNYIYFNKKNSKELADYYNSADLGFFLHRQINAGLGLTTEESLSSGTPSIVPHRPGIKKISGLFQINVSFKEANKTIRNFFKLSLKERESMSKNVRKFILEDYSGLKLQENYSQVYFS
jgi:glycosyltransferase involved in cell wall biosynthesis